MTEWYVYIVRCSDDSLYTGITTDVRRRLEEHNYKNNAAAYTRSRRPVALIYREKFRNRSTAARREREIRTLTKKEKEKLVNKVRG